MLKRITFFLLLLIPFFGTAQLVPKELKGKVASAKANVSGVHVLNISQNKATITNAKGDFSITAKVWDTLVFSAVQFKKKQLIVSHKMLTAKSTTVFLKKAVVELDEVVVRNQVVTAKSLGLPNADVVVLPQSERLLHDADHGSFVKYYGIAVVINLNKVLNAVSGRTKMLKKRVARDKKYLRSQNMRNKFSDSIFKNRYGIPLERIEEFMLFCEYDTRFSYVAVYGNDLDLLGFMRRKSEEFRKNNDLD